MVFTGRNEVVAKVMFLLEFVILFTGGSASVHAGILTPPAKETPPRRRRHPPAKETPPRPTPKGEIEGDQVQAHTQGGN